MFAKVGSRCSPVDAVGLCRSLRADGGRARNYRGIPAEKVAAAMIAAAATERTGQHIHTYADMIVGIER
jgi:hypothetical protein